MKTVGAVLLACVVIFVLFAVMFTGLYVVMGPEQAFRPKSYEVSVQWIVMSVALSALAAIIGGMIAQKVGEDLGGIWICALLLLLGLGMAIPSIGAPSPGERGGDVASMDAMAKAITPTWVQFLNAFIGPAAAWLGASFIRNRS